MTEPRVEQAGATLYLVDGDGVRWRVYDTVYRAFRHQRLALGSVRAENRVFVREDGLRRLHRLKDGARGLEAATLATQLQGAEYVAREPYRADDDAPGRPGG